MVFGIDEAFLQVDRFPAALLRGGSFIEGADAGVFALSAVFGPSVPAEAFPSKVTPFGFRCGR